MLHDLAMVTRAMRGLPKFLRTPITASTARAIVARRLERRREDLLSLLRHTVFDYPHSPYLALMQAAGCEYGDVERMLYEDGVEGALRRLFRAGVYLTIDEFKGRHPA